MGGKKKIFWEKSIFIRPQGSIQMFGFLSRVYTHQAVKSVCPRDVAQWQRQEKVTCLVFVCGVNCETLTGARGGGRQGGRRPEVRLSLRRGCTG